MTWQAGDRVTVRRTEWRVVSRTRFADCEGLNLAHEDGRGSRTFLVPFDRPRQTPPRRLRAVGPRACAAHVRDLLLRVHPYGGLRFCPPGIHLLPYQLEPALAVLRHGADRVLVADEVGMGKTIEAGLIIREVVLADRLARVLVICPASIRAQWASELEARFELQACAADAAWLRRSAGELPPDVNPWSLPGVYIASIDFLKRPEALAPLDDLRWTLLIVDEAHAATPGSDRRAALHSLACRARQVVLLTATPHSGDPAQFAALCGLGAYVSSPPILCFRRSLAALPAARPPRRKLLRVRLTPAEHRLHRLVARYTHVLWTAADARRDPTGRLLATMLRKRSLSGPHALALSVDRRLRLIRAAEPPPAQLGLPWADEDAIPADAPGDEELGWRSGSDEAEEHERLETLQQHASAAALHDSKLRALLTLTRRAREPVLVFTEYRDTADDLASRLRETGKTVLVLHGGLHQEARSAVVERFAGGGAILVATDAASEGLNLHHACRLVVHFELPWTPLRLHQRCGRVHRIGQARRVHEIALVADDTCEQLVLAPLARRMVEARSFGPTSLLQPVAEGDVAAHVLAGTPMADPAPADLGEHVRFLDLSADAACEAARLSSLRRLTPPHPHRPPRVGRGLPVARVHPRRWGRLASTVTLVVLVTVRTAGSGRRLGQMVVPLSVEGPAGPWPRRNDAIVGRVNALWTTAWAAAAEGVARPAAALLSSVAAAYEPAARALREREWELQRTLRSAAREMVQAGLFDRRALRTAARRLLQRQGALEELDATAIAADGELLQVEHHVEAVLVGDGR